MWGASCKYTLSWNINLMSVIHNSSKLLLKVTLLAIIKVSQWHTHTYTYTSLEVLIKTATLQLLFHFYVTSLSAVCVYLLMPMAVASLTAMGGIWQGMNRGSRIYWPNARAMTAIPAGLKTSTQTKNTWMNQHFNQIITVNIIDYCYVVILSLK